MIPGNSRKLIKISDMLNEHFAVKWTVYAEIHSELKKSNVFWFHCIKSVIININHQVNILT